MTADAFASAVFVSPKLSLDALLLQIVNYITHALHNPSYPSYCHRTVFIGGEGGI